VELEKNEQELGGELKKLRQSRDGVTPDIPPSAMSVYEGLRKTRDGVAVSRVVRLMCQQCRLTLPTMELQRARAAQTIVQCSSCQRILCPV
jgi:predicted  nucleic acid-binding Zn-ribbon protein